MLVMVYISTAAKTELHVIKIERDERMSDDYVATQTLVSSPVRMKEWTFSVWIMAVDMASPSGSNTLVAIADTKNEEQIKISIKELKNSGIALSVTIGDNPYTLKLDQSTVELMESKLTEITIIAKKTKLSLHVNGIEVDKLSKRPKLLSFQAEKVRFAKNIERIIIAEPYISNEAVAIDKVVRAECNFGATIEGNKLPRFEEEHVVDDDKYYEKIEVQCEPGDGHVQLSTTEKL